MLFSKVLTLSLLSAVWITPEAVKKLPMSGSGWSAVQKGASTSDSPDMSDQNDNHDVFTLAKALVAVRTGNATDVAKAKAELLKGLASVHGGRTLAIGRNLCSYVVAADLLSAQLSAQDKADIAADLKKILATSFEGETLTQTHERRPNNWGTMAGASRLAAAVYLKDSAQIARCATVFKGWLGDRNSYAGFSYGDKSWQFDSSKPVGINPKGAMKSGKDIDGVLPDDVRRGGSFPSIGDTGTSYMYEALQGAIVQAQILQMQGYPAFTWQDKALLRAFEWLHDVAKCPADNNDRWQMFLINSAYGSNFPESTSATYGKVMGWTSWTHQ